ncbi:hypothetical protein [Pedobacter panaciterrae]
MLSIINVLRNKLGIDRAIAYTIISRIVQALAGVVSIIFIAKFLTKAEQGYYFTFGSLLAIQIFFELGLSSIITQFVAHEKAFLKWESNIELTGSDESLSRLSYLLRFCLKWFCVISIILLLVLLITGYFFFTKYKKAENIEWQIPWIILSVSTALALITSPILAFFEGLGIIAEVAKIRLIQQVFQLILLFSFLAIGFKLLASPIAAILGFLVIPIWIFFSYKKELLRSIWKGLGEWKVNYMTEIFPYQWRIALSWISGYLIYQLFNPVLFATEGPVVAGQMGMTLAALNGVLSISIGWTNTKVPMFSNLIAKKDFKSLDRSFNQTVKMTSMICAGSLILLLILVLSLQYMHIEIGNRFLPTLPLILLSITTFATQIIYSLATYLRCHKEEPLLRQSIVMGGLTAGSTIILGKFYGVIGITGGYSFLVVVVSSIWTWVVFKEKRKLWHQ